MKYSINFQYRPKNSARPEDEPLQFDIQTETEETIPIPNIGDHVVFLRHGKPEQVHGVVENRLFMYLTGGLCTVNIVVTDSDVDSGKLIKE